MLHSRSSMAGWFRCRSITVKCLYFDAIYRALHIATSRTCILARSLFALARADPGLQSGDRSGLRLRVFGCLRALTSNFFPWFNFGALWKIAQFWCFLRGVWWGRVLPTVPSPDFTLESCWSGESGEAQSTQDAGCDAQRNASIWALLMWMGVSTLHTSNIKGKTFKFACALRPASCVDWAWRKQFWSFKAFCSSEWGTHPIETNSRFANHFQTRHKRAFFHRNSTPCLKRIKFLPPLLVLKIDNTSRFATVISVSKEVYDKPCHNLSRELAVFMEQGLLASCAKSGTELFFRLGSQSTPEADLRGFLMSD